MSAFCGIYQLDGQPLNREKLDFISSKLALWQPDKTFQWIEGSLGVSQWHRAYTPQAEHVSFPVTNHHKHYLLASNTRLDNRDELAEQLAINKIVAKELSDEALILMAYEKWQEDCSKYLLGDFSFVIWDGNKQQLFLSRDQNGHCKTIYYYYLPGKLFVFASNVRPIYEHPSVPIAPDDFAISNYLLFKTPHKSKTFYKDIIRLPVGYSLVITKKRLRLQQYFSWKRGKKIRYQNDQDYLDHFNEIFHHAVSDRLRSSTKMGGQLSGGLDSSSIMAVAAKIIEPMNQTITAFGAIPEPNGETLTPPGFISDESEYMEALANKYSNIELIKVINNAHSYFQDTSRAFLYTETLSGAIMNRLWIENIQTLCQEFNIRNLLCGDFGNDSISWGGSPPIRSLKGRIKRFLKHYGSPIKDIYNSANGRFPWDPLGCIHPSFTKKYRLIWRYLKPSNQAPNDLNYASSWLSTDSSFINSGYEAIFGIESRDPTQDLRILDYCRSLPSSQFCNQEDNRLLIKRAMVDCLPKKIRERPLVGFQLHHWQRKFKNSGDILEQNIQKALSSQRQQKILKANVMYTQLLQCLSLCPNKWDEDYYQKSLILVENCMMISFLQEYM